MNSNDIKNSKKLLKLIAVLAVLISGVGTSYAQSNLSFFYNKIKYQPKSKPLPPKLSEVQIRNYSNLMADKATIPATPAEALGYGYKKSMDNNQVEKAKVNQSLINAQSSAIEELLDKEESLKIHIDRIPVMSQLEDVDVSQAVDSELASDVDAYPLFYPQLENNQFSSTIPLQVVAVENDLTNFKIQALEKQAMTHLSSIDFSSEDSQSKSEITPVKTVTKKVVNSSVRQSESTPSAIAIKPFVTPVNLPKNKLRNLPKIAPLQKSDPQKALIANARRHSELPDTAHTVNAVSLNLSNNSDNASEKIPAFRRLMDMGISEIKSNQLDKAHESFTKAQRMIPDSSAVYFYLGQVSLKKQQPNKAEAFARRGLSVSNNQNRKRGLWEVILKSAQMSDNKRAMIEAEKMLE